MAASDHAHVETPRLTLSPVRPEDAAAVASAIGNYDVVRWLGRVPYPYRRSDAEAFIAANANRPGRVWFIHDGSGLVGGISIDGELGFWVRRDRWGRGYVTEAADAAIDVHFADASARSLEAGHFLGNDRSRRVLRKLGFEPAGIRTVASRVLAQPVPSQQMLLSRSRWEDRRRYRVETDRLVIREVRPGDWPAVQRMGADPAVAGMLVPARGFWSEAEVRRWMLASRYRGRPGFRPVVTLRNGCIIGVLALGHGQEDAEPSIAFVLDPSARGQGYAREAVTAFLADITARFGLDAVSAACMDGYPISAQVLERLGFERVGDAARADAARLEPAPMFLYRVSREALGARS